MHGVPPDLNLAFLESAELTQVAIGVYQIQLSFHPTGAISSEGGWELLDKDGSKIDGLMPVPRSAPYQLHLLLGQRVVGTTISAPDWFAIEFERGELLRVFDDSPQYESFSVNGQYI
jgi:hypothetical protein